MAKGPTNKTDPDKDDDHKGFGATDVGPGEADRDEEGTTGLTGNSDASIKGSWLTQLIGELTIDGGLAVKYMGYAQAEMRWQCLQHCFAKQCML